MMAILDDMNRLENWICLVGRGDYLEVSLSHEDFGDTLSLPRQVYFYWLLFTLFCVLLVFLMVPDHQLCRITKT
jgi:hypothetical protein